MRDGVLVIAICGPIGVGKSSCEAQLIERLRAIGAFGSHDNCLIRHLETLPLAQPLKRSAEHLLAPFLDGRVLERSLYGPSEYRETAIPAFAATDNPLRSVRRFLQWYGTDVFRAIDERFWLNHWRYAVERVAHNRSTPAVVIVPDVRFTNEALEVLDGWNGLLLRLQFRADGREQGTSHSSESGLAGFGFDFYRQQGRVFEFTRGRANGPDSMAAQAAWVEVVAAAVVSHIKEFHR